MSVEPVRLTAFNGGELDPRLFGRRDVKIYFQCLALAENLSLPPGGAINRRPGTTFIDQVRPKLDLLDFTAAMVVDLPLGGTAADLTAHDADVFVTDDGLGAADVVLFEIDLGSAQAIACIDLIDFAVIAGGPDPPPAVEPPIQYPWPEVPEIYVPFGGFGGGGLPL